MQTIFRWIPPSGECCEYRFTDGICDGFFVNDIECHQEQGYKGRLLKTDKKRILSLGGFKQISYSFSHKNAIIKAPKPL